MHPAQLEVYAEKTLKDVKEMIGHWDLKMTDRYSHLTPDDKHDIQNKLAEYSPIYVRGFELYQCTLISSNVGIWQACTNFEALKIRSYIRSIL